MSQKLGALFISAALGPVTYAGSCIMAQRVKDGLAELNPDSLMGGVNRGVATIADATGLPSEHIERLLPMPQLRRLAERIGPKQRTALTQWDIHTSHIGGLLAGVADLTVDGRAPDTALCLMRLSQKMQMDKALALPLRELSEDLESWRHLLETCRMIINDGDSLRSAHLQRRILRGGFAIAGLLAVAAVVVWIVRVRSARQRIDDLLIASDPCASISIDDSDRGKASEDQLKMLEKRATECETKRAADHNLRAAYMHVLADALTSIFAIVALTAGRTLGWVWLDPTMGLVGSLIIARWSYGLLRETSAVLLDGAVPAEVVRDMRARLEHEAGTGLADLHLWRVGPGHMAAIVALVADRPQPPDAYKAKLGDLHQISHLTVEVHCCPDHAAEHAAA